LANPALESSSQIYFGGIIKERLSEKDRNKKYIYNERGFLYLVEKKLGDKTEVLREYYPWGTLKEDFTTKAKFLGNGLHERMRDLKPLLTSQEDASSLIRGYEDEKTKRLLPIDIRKPSFKNNMIDGEFAFYSEGSSPAQVMKANYDEGILSGPISTFFKSSVDKFSGFTANGVMAGEYRRFQDVEDSPVLREKGTYSKGVLDGVVTLYYGEDRKFAEISLMRGILNGPVKKYFKSGIVEESCGFSDALREGECSVFEKNGQVVVKANYSKGKRTGSWTEWHDNGSKKREAKYIHGKLDGEVLSYHNNGKISKRENYKSNLLDGVSTHYNKDGSIKGSVLYKDNLKDGSTKVYYPSGKLELEVNFKSGVKDGLQRKYYETGELQEETKFSNGKQVGFSQSYYKSGVKMGGGGAIDNSRPLGK
jgi:antitoxin component YwqK of YwqJK toxin-antitoxin module